MSKPQLSEAEIERHLKILAKVLALLKENGYTVILNRERVRLELSKTLPSELVNIFLRVPDELHLRLSIMYFSIPLYGRKEDIERWVKSIISRADFCIETQENGDEHIVINKDYQFSHDALGISLASDGDSLRLFRRIRDAYGEVLRWRKQDLDNADESSLRW